MATKKNNHRIRADFKHASNFNLHIDAKDALERLVAALPNYTKYMIVSFAIMSLEKEVARQKISSTDDLEERLDLLK